MPDKDTTEDGPVIRPFSDWLREQSKGATHDELSEALHELTARVADTRRPGSLTFTVSIKPLKGAADSDALTVTDQIKLKLPEHDRKASLFWPDADGNLRRTDPNQLSFESLREVGGQQVDTTTGEIKEKRA